MFLQNNRFLVPKEFVNYSDQLSYNVRKCLKGKIEFCINRTEGETEAIRSNHVLSFDIPKKIH
jgi:hypothetical protein